MKEDTEDAREQLDHLITRRQILLTGGATVVGASLFGTLSDLAWGQTTMQRGVSTKNGGTKPIYVPDSGNNDPVAHSLADNLFWNDILMEHATFFIMLMPGSELAEQRGRAEKFQASFKSQFAKAQSASVDRSNYAALNQSTIELVKPFIDFKREMKAAQEAGKLNSLVWPLFFEHTAHEADRFTRRLSRLSSGEAGLERAEVIEFWSQIMAEHADFIAHLLDPQESALVQKAMQTSTAFRNLRTQKPSSKDPVEKAVNDIIDFKTAAEKGIQTGKIKSIIHPALADHVRREAIKFADELKRAA
jgi:Domain of unknown function (DUF2935)